MAKRTVKNSLVIVEGPSARTTLEIEIRRYLFFIAKAQQSDNIPFIASEYGPSRDCTKLREETCERISNLSLLFSRLSDLIPETKS